MVTPSPHDVSEIYRAICVCARKCLGNRSQYFDEHSQHYVALSNDAIWRLMGLPVFENEVVLRRLKRLQRWARAPTLHEQEIGVCM